jgi:hypothetical protein
VEDLKRNEFLTIMANCSGDDGELLRDWLDNFSRGRLPYEGEWLPADQIRTLSRRRSVSRLKLVELWVFFGLIIIIELGLLLVVRGLHS